MARRKTKAPHPRDLHDARQIAKAEGFCAHIRLGPTEVHNVRVATAEEAFREAERLTREHGRFGRRACPYAILPGGGVLHISPALIALAEEIRAGARA